jgi:hypothetical protein
MRTTTECPGCGGQVVSAEPDPLNTNPDAGIVKTHAIDLTGEDLAVSWHYRCRERDKKRRGRDAVPELSTIDWEAQVAAVLAEAEDAA